jgi:hypothetical protein
MTGRLAGCQSAKHMTNRSLTMTTGRMPWFVDGMLDVESCLLSRHSREGAKPALGLPTWSGLGMPYYQFSGRTAKLLYKTQRNGEAVTYSAVFVGIRCPCMPPMLCQTINGDDTVGFSSLDRGAKFECFQSAGSISKHKTSSSAASRSHTPHPSSGNPLMESVRSE